MAQYSSSDLRRGEQFADTSRSFERPPLTDLITDLYPITYFPLLITIERLAFIDSYVIDQTRECEKVQNDPH